MSQIQIQKIECINAFCKNVLTDFELSRMNGRFNKFRFCRRCRGTSHKINATLCDECGVIINNNNFRLYCRDCIKKRYRDRQKLKYQKTKILPKIDMVLEYLYSGKPATVKIMASSLETTSGTIRTCIFNLRKYGKKNIVFGYNIVGENNTDRHKKPKTEMVYQFLKNNKNSTKQAICDALQMDLKQVKYSLHSLRYYHKIAIRLEYKLEP